ncbi:NACHT domain-containing protein [Acrocarpospora catenulata]|uniref:NACHT domain-containing protein n=1 Tax=Acrocarpospora catenulata TaxID=2836182 RepID=UPI001BDB228B|nr:hypothetical protein [Acrocarpospora catenulata]
MTSNEETTRKRGRGGQTVKGVTRPDPEAAEPEFRPWAELACRLYDELYATRPPAGRPGINELAKATNYAGAMISYVFSGKRRYSWQVFRAIVRALGGRPGEWKARWDATERRHREETRLRGLLPLPGLDQDAAVPDRAVGDWGSPAKPPIRRMSRWLAKIGAVAFTAALEAVLVMLALTLPAPGSYLAGACAAALTALLGRWWLRRRANVSHRRRLKLLRMVRDKAGKEAARAQAYYYLIPRFTLLDEEPGGKKRGSRPELIRTDTTVTDIRALFEQGGDELTLLADAGLGKSAQLAKLAHALAEEAIAELEAEPGHPGRPLPVLLNLATYRGEAFEDWLVAEVHRAYDHTPEQFVRTWLADDLLLPILDGLDHVPSAHRRECAAQLRRFRRQAAGLVLSCRNRDVQLALTVDTALRVELARPSRQDVQEYLIANPDGLAPVREALDADTGLWPLLQSPLMLDIIRLTYTGRPADDLRRPGSPAERRKRLFDAYLAQRLQGHPNPYAALCRLTWLAQTLTTRGEQVLYLDRLDLDWLSPAARKVPRAATGGAATITLWIMTVGWMAVAIHTGAIQARLPDVALLAGITVLVTCCQIVISERLADSRQESPGKAVVLNIPAILIGGAALQRIDWGSQGVILALLIAAWGYITTMEGGFRPVFKPVERMRWTWRPTEFLLYSPRNQALVRGTVATLLNVVKALLFGYAFHLYFPEPVWLPYTATVLLVVIYLLGNNFEPSLDDDRTRPNEGIRRSARYALAHGALNALIVALALLLLVTLSTGHLDTTPAWLLAALFAGLYGLARAFRYGGLALIQYWTVRLVLTALGYIPLRYQRFLEDAEHRILLYRTGSGFTYPHRLIQEHLDTAAREEDPDTFWQRLPDHS